MPILIAFLVLALLAPGATAQCSVPLQPTSWTAACAMQPYTGPGTPLLHITLTADVERVFRTENRNPFSVGVVTSSLNRVRYEFSMDPTFATQLDTFVIPVRAATFVLPPADGSVDFAGDSGRTVTTLQAGLVLGTTATPTGPVSIPWTLYVRAIGGVVIEQTGGMTSMQDYRASALVGVRYIAPGL